LHSGLDDIQRESDDGSYDASGKSAESLFPQVHIFEGLHCCWNVVVAVSGRASPKKDWAEGRSGTRNIVIHSLPGEKKN
jgi:hypothetical protein